MLSLLTRENYENCIFPFWKRLADDERGGFFGKVGYDLAVDRDAPKGVIQNSRILWFFSNAYLTYADGEALCFADHAYKFLHEHCLDRENGGVYRLLNPDGTARDTFKYTCDQVCAVHALASYHDATGNNHALETAFEIFQLVEELCTDEAGCLEAFNREFFPIDAGPFSGGGFPAQRKTDTMLHMVEAYTELYRVSGDEHVEERLRKLIDLFINKIYNPKERRFELYFDHGFTSAANVQSFGHDIGASWVLDKACEVLEDYRLLSRVRECTGSIADSVYERGFINGSLIRETADGIQNSARDWYVQAEGIIGFINAYKYTSDTKFLNAATSLWSFITDYLVDKRENGEWLPQLDEHLMINEKIPVAGQFKSPYHNGRMCFELTKRGF